MHLPFAYVKNPIDRINNMRAYYYARLSQHLSRRSRAIRQRLIAKDELRRIDAEVNRLLEASNTRERQCGAVEMHSKVGYILKNPTIDERTRRDAKKAKTKIARELFELDV